MIIDRFGATYETAYQLPQSNAQDDHEIVRPPVYAQVGGMGGAFDFYGTNNYPVAPMIVRKNMSLLRKGTVAGAGHVSIGFAGDVAVIGSGTAFLSTVMAGDVLDIAYGSPIREVKTVAAVTTDTDLTVTTPFTIGHFNDHYKISSVPSRSSVEVAIDEIHAATVSANESKLWALRRDGARRWAWAKCTSLKTADKVGNVYHLPASIEFLCCEGLWYAESQSGTSITQAALSYALTNVGNTYAGFELTITSSSGTLTAVTVTNTTNGDTFTWTGSAGTGQTLVVNTSEYTVKKAGVGAYSGISCGTNQVNWLRLNPGLNTVTIAVTGSTAWSGSMAWWDTYL